MSGGRLRHKVSEALRGAALRSADAAYHQGRRTFFSMEERSRGLRAASEQMAGRMFKLGQRLIEQSPIPVPNLAKDAFGRMQDALHQLEHVIESGDISRLKDRGDLRRSGTVEVKGGHEAMPPLDHKKQQSQQRGKQAQRHQN